MQNLQQHHAADITFNIVNDPNNASFNTTQSTTEIYTSVKIFKHAQRIICKGFNRGLILFKCGLFKVISRICMNGLEFDTFEWNLTAWSWFLIQRGARKEWGREMLLQGVVGFVNKILNSGIRLFSKDSASHNGVASF